VDEASLTTAFGLGSAVRLVTVVGAGGKTSFLYAAAAELSGLGKRVVTTTTTKIFSPNARQSPELILGSQDAVLDGARKAFTRGDHVTVGSGLLPNGKVDGVSEETIRLLLEIADIVIVEGDGALGRPIKAPETWEPVIPALTDLVVPIAGLDCLAKPADESTVFRLNRFLALTGMREGDRISPQIIAGLLGHAEGGLKGVPTGAMVIPFLNKIDQVADVRVVEVIASRILLDAAQKITRVVSGSAGHGRNYAIHSIQ
jgi:probable selenium-dependent hydroxylase accessory protein YqeC